MVSQDSRRSELKVVLVVSDFLNEKRRTLAGVEEEEEQQKEVSPPPS